MKQKKTALLLAVTASLALSLSGCSDKNDSASGNVTNYYSVTMDGDMIYYDETSENVVNAGNVACQFLEASVSKSYLDPNSHNEYDYYRKSVADDLIANKRQEQTKQQIVESQLIIKAYEQTVQNIEFYYLNGLETCTVTVESISGFDHATPEYIASAGISVGKKYKRTAKVLLVNEDGWKVDSYTQTPREELK